jgi:hypothetical protein
VLQADCVLKFCATTLGRTAKKRYASVLVATQKYVGIKLAIVSSANAGNGSVFERRAVDEDAVVPPSI